MGKQFVLWSGKVDGVDMRVSRTGASLSVEEQLDNGRWTECQDDEFCLVAMGRTALALHDALQKAGG
jgi:hypothetical protein